MTLDYRKPAGRKVLDRLASKADVLLTNIRPGVEKQLCIEYARLQALKPRLVYCSITGFGASGPHSQRPAYDNVGQALSGWLSMFHEGSDARVPGPAVADAVTGQFAALGILGALIQRFETGRGRHVEVSMLEAMIAFAAEPLGKLFDSGQSVGLYARAAASQSFIVHGGIGLSREMPFGADVPGCAQPHHYRGIIGNAEDHHCQRRAVRPWHPGSACGMIGS